MVREQGRSRTCGALMANEGLLGQAPRASRRETSRKGSSLPKAGCIGAETLALLRRWSRLPPVLAPSGPGHPSACATRRRLLDPGLDPVRRHAGLN